jgi:hypothetical protein
MQYRALAAAVHRDRKDPKARREAALALKDQPDPKAMPDPKVMLAVTVHKEI